MNVRNLAKIIAPPHHPELDRAALERAADAYFPNGVGVSAAGLAERSAAFYGGVDLTRRGTIWHEGDQRSLERTIELAVRAARHAPRRRGGPVRLLIIGCGDGRLLPYIAGLAQVNGVDELILNDLHAFQVEAAAAVIATAGVVGSGLRVRLLAGDIVARASEVTCDVALAWYFVDAEIVSVASVAALRARRQAYHTAMAECLAPGGAFILDRPDASTGFYAAVKELTHDILTARGLMPGEAGNLDLTHIPGGPQPYHLRYVPEDAAHRRAMKSAGFVPLDERVQIAAEDASHGLRRQKVVGVWQLQRPRERSATMLTTLGLHDAGARTVAA